MSKFKYIKLQYPKVLLLGVVSFFTDIASEMLYPITPIFLSTVLGASMVSVGVIEGLAEGTSSLLKTYFGFWSDKISKRLPFLYLGYLLSAISRPLIGFSTTATQVMGARLTDRFGKGLRTAPRDALIADYVRPQDMGLAFGWHRMIDTMGAVVGPLLGIWLISYITDLRQVFFWALIPGLLSFSFLFLISEPVQKKIESSSQPKLQLRWNVFNSDYKFFVFTWGIFCLTNSSDAFLILKMRDTGLSMTSVLLIYAFFNLVYALCSPYFGSLSDRWSKRKTMMVGLLIFAFVYLGFAFANNWLHYIFLMGCYGVFMAATEGVGKAYVSQLVESDRRATALGILGTVVGLCQVFSSILAGVIWQNYGASYAFLLGVVGSLLFIILNFFHFRRVKCES